MITARTTDSFVLLMFIVSPLLRLPAVSAKWKFAILLNQPHRDNPWPENLSNKLKRYGHA
jgi:hypothetical protein